MENVAWNWRISVFVWMKLNRFDIFVPVKKLHEKIMIEIGIPIKGKDDWSLLHCERESLVTSIYVFPNKNRKSVKGHDFILYTDLFQKTVAFDFIAQCTRIKSQLETANGSKVYFFSNKIHLRFALYWPIAWLYESNSTKNLLKCKSCSDFGTIELTVYQTGEKRLNELSNPSFNNDTLKMIGMNKAPVKLNFKFTKARSQWTIKRQFVNLTGKNAQPTVKLKGKREETAWYKQNKVTTAGGCDRK